MLKRFQAMNLFHGKDSLDVKEWIEASKELPSQRNGIFKVKLSNEDIITAYYCSDMIIFHAHHLNVKPSTWWSKLTQEPIYNVTHWGKTDETSS